MTKFLKPAKKKNVYVAKPSSSIRIWIRGTKIRQIHPLVGGGSVVTFWISPYVHAYACEELEAIDIIARDAVVQNNSFWFNNNLSCEEIKANFRTSFAEESISALLSDAKRPILSGEMDVSDAEGCWSDVLLEAQGIYFYPKRFGIRWLIKKMEIFREDPAIEKLREANHDATSSRIDIEESWNEEVEKLHKRWIEASAVLDQAKNREYPDAEWNTLLEKLNYIIK